MDSAVTLLEQTQKQLVRVVTSNFGMDVIAYAVSKPHYYSAGYSVSEALGRLFFGSGILNLEKPILAVGSSFEELGEAVLKAVQANAVEVKIEFLMADTFI